MTPVLIFGLAVMSVGAPPVRPEGLLMLARHVAAYSTEPDYEKLTKTIGEWQTRPKADRVILIAALARRLSSNEKIPLKNTSDLIIMNRILSGEMKFYGHGLVVRQDLFVAGGKAAWAIGELISVDNLPEIVAGQTEEEREAIIKTIRKRIDYYIKHD